MGRQCFRAMVRLRGELSCAACDGANDKHFKDVAGLKLDDKSMQKLNSCIEFMNKFNGYKQLLTDMLAMAKDITGDSKIAEAQKKLAAFHWKVNEDCFDGKAAPKGSAGKPDAKPAAKPAAKP